LPRSGKTTWAKGQGYPIVCPDAVRLALHGLRFVPLAEPLVWAIVKVMVRALFLAGHDIVIVDATNTTRKRRDDWQSKDWTTLFQVIGTPKDECIRRARAINDEEIVPIIERQAEQFEPLESDELRYD
jgi:predicted kinase